MTAILSRPPGFHYGDLIPGFGYGRCFRCHRPWWAAPEPHTVWVSTGFGQFTLCEPCWRRSTLAERMAAHRWLATQRDDPAAWEKVSAVLSDQLDSAGG